MKKKLVAMTFGRGGIHAPGTKPLPTLKEGEFMEIRYYSDGTSKMEKLRFDRKQSLKNISVK
jgi:hypothetical protein